MSLKKINLISLLFLGVTISSVAQQNDSVVHQLTEIIIEAKAEADAIQKQKESGTAKIVISKKDLNGFGHHAAGDVIKYLPRVFVQGPPSFNRNIMMAGLDKEFQTVLIDGNRPGGGEDSRDFKLDRIPTEMIESIEVIYNPPVSYGADATIGLVDIKLKDVPDKEFISTDLVFDFTSTKTAINPNFNLAYGNKWNKWSVFATYNYNHFKRQNIKHTWDTIAAGTDYEDVTVNIHGASTTLAYQPDSTVTIKLKSFYTDYRENLQLNTNIKKNSDGELSFRADTANDDKVRLLHAHTLSFEKDFKNSCWENSLTLAQHFDKKDRLRHQEKTAGLTISLEDEDQKNTELIFESSVSKKLKGKGLDHKMVFGVRTSALWRNYDRITYSKISGRLFWDEIIDGSYTLYEYRASIFASDELTIGKLWLMPALRYDFDLRHYSIDEVNEQGDYDYNYLNPSLHLKYKLTDNVFIKADAARQIARPPFNNQVPVDKVKHKKETIERGNPDLKPSTARNIGLGTELYFQQNSYIAFRGFYSILRNVVETRGVGIDNVYGYKILQAVNVDSGLVWGCEVDLYLKLIDGSLNRLNYSGNFSWLGSEVRDPGTFELRRLNEQPEWMTNSTLDYFNLFLKTQFSIAANYTAKRYIAATSSDGSWVNGLVYEPYLQMDARVKYFFTNWGSVYLNVNNLLNSKMENSQGIVNESEIIGRNWILGVNLRF